MTKPTTLTVSTTVEVFYSKGHTGVPLPPTLDPLPGLLATLGKAQHTIVFGIFSFTAQPILDELLNRQAAGVAIRGVADKGETSSPTSKVAALRNAGVDVKLVGTQYNLMHLKVAVVDGLLCALGSYNWTTQAETANDEDLVVIHSTKLGDVLTAQVDAIRARAV